MKQWKLKYHEIDEIAEDTYRISESNGLEFFYLLVGTEKALLIDNGNSSGDVGEVVRTVTDKPVECVLTHNHCDHAGGTGWFPFAYAGAGDIRYEYEFGCDIRIMEWWAKSNKRPFENMEKPYEKKLVPVEDGHVFDLGGRKATVYVHPGHSLGHLTITDDKTKFMFIGDNAGRNCMMAMGGATSIVRWIDTLKILYDMAEEYTPWWGHMGGVMNRQHIADAIEGAKEIIATHPANAPEDTEEVFPYGTVKIRYNARRIYDMEGIDPGGFYHRVMAIAPSVRGEEIKK